MPDTRRHFLKRAAVGMSGALAVRQPAGTIDRTAALRTPQSGETVLTCGGDWFLTRPISTNATAETGAVFDVFRRSDAAFANLENGLSTVGSGELGGFRQGAPLRGRPELASELTWAGVRAVSLANNHTGNYGRPALLQTIETLDRARIAHAGAGANLDGALGPAMVTAGALNVAFFSIYTLYDQFAGDDHATETQPGIAVCRAYDVIVEPPMGFDPAPAVTSPYIAGLQQPSTQTIIAASRGDTDRIKAAIRLAASRADFVLLSVHVHWGRHTKHDLPPYFRAFAHEMIDAGVDLFVGHGPHAIRGIEVYRGKPIVHSMGNLVLRPPERGAPPVAATSPGREGLVVRATVTRRMVRALEVLPIAIEANGDPRLASNEEAARTLGTLNGLSAPFGLEMRVNGWFAEVDVV